MTMSLPSHSNHEDAEARLDAAVRDCLLPTPPTDLAARLMALVPQATPEPAPSRFDLAIKENIVLAAPPELTARLLALVPQESTAVEPVVVAQPAVSRPWMRIAYAVMAIGAGVLLVFFGQLYADWLSQAGAPELLARLSELPATWLSQLQALVPQTTALIALYRGLQQPLQWLLVGLVLWAILEMRSPQVQTT